MYPIVERMGLNEQQGVAVAHRGSDIVVTAGAGTGKTLTLVARYLSLLAEGLPLRSIVAVTFTRKAAREMRNRVRDEMRGFVSSRPLEAGDRERWEVLQRELDAARIGTIHSLCGEILRSSPAEARVDPAFEVLDEGKSGILKSEAMDRAMAWAADADQTVVLFRLLGDRGLRDCLERLMSRRLDASEAFAATGSDVLAEWEAQLASEQKSALDTLRGSAGWESWCRTIRECDSADAEDLIAQQARAAKNALDGSHGSTSEALSALSGLGDIKLTGGRAGAWPGGTEQLQEVKAALKALRSAWKAQKDVLGIALGPGDVEMAEVLPGLRKVFDYCVGVYDRSKDDVYALDYEDLENRALALLKGSTSVRERWQTEVEAILVDEFQDTNSRQRRIVDLLNGDGHRLFVVGDAKQSIYRFRGADVEVFRSMRQSIAQDGGRVVSLDRSYRLHEQLQITFDGLLGPVLGDTADDLQPWVEPYSRLKADRWQPANGLSGPFVELHLAVGPKGDGGLFRAAGMLADRLIELVEGSEVLLASRSGTQRLGYGDIAILCRGSGSFGAYEDALEQSGVPFLTVSGRGFYGRPEIRDLLNALAALSDPTDDLALIGLLRSPVIGLSDVALFELINERRMAAPELSLWAWLTRRAPESALECGADPADAVALVSVIHEMVGRTSVGEVLKAFLDATDYRAALRRSGQNRAVRNIGKLLADAHSSAAVGVGEFSEYVRHLRDVGSREGEARAIAGESVQIMSVHGAKGLEFPVVVLGDAGFGGGGGRDGVMLDRQLGVLLSLEDEEGDKPGAYLLAKQRDGKRDEAESGRLLYVAATRAREMLLVSGCLSLKKDGAPGKSSGWLASFADQLKLEELDLSEFDAEGPHGMSMDLPVGPGRARLIVAGAEHAPIRRELADTETTVAETEPRQSMLDPVGATTKDKTDADAGERERNPPRKVWRVVPDTVRAYAPAWVVGSMVHETIAAWRFPARRAPDEAFAQWAESRARAHGLTDRRQLESAVERCADLVLRFSESPLRREMESADRRLHEVPYSRTVDASSAEPRVEVGVIDALFLAGGRWTIVEFKTDRLPGDLDIAEYLHSDESGDDYRRQVSNYAAAVTELVGAEPMVKLCLLDVGGQVHVEPDPHVLGTGDIV